MIESRHVYVKSGDGYVLDTGMMDKLKILADAAKYDVSCASSGVDRKNNGGLGNATACGICHSWSSDGRCISLLKILMTNDCVFDCAYCINRQSNDIKRASFTPKEIAMLTIEFYRRNYIEGLFLSSAVEHNVNATMEKILKTLVILRNEENFSGYIHIKAIPGADPLLIQKAGELADRMSVNVELPSRESLQLLAPQKSVKKLFLPMQQINNGIIQAKEEKQKYHYAKKFVPAGQSTQIIVGATPDSDRSILMATEKMYNQFNLKRVYFSAYMPVNEGKNLPALLQAPPLLREHRLYQADWLLRFYHFSAKELLSEADRNFDLDFDPKMHWALKHIELFPIEITKASYQELLRIPGIGTTSALRIIRQRRKYPIHYDDLKKMGAVMKRAKYFLVCNGRFEGIMNFDINRIKSELKPKENFEQLTLF